MKRLPAFWLGILVWFSFCGHHALAADIPIRTVEMDYLRLVSFADEHQYIVPHLARCFQNSLNFS